LPFDLAKTSEHFSVSLPKGRVLDARWRESRDFEARNPALLEWDRLVRADEQGGEGA
jgi:hypothetical protein